MSGTSKVAKVSVALTAELTALVQQAVASGDYASGSEVIREALREWKHRRGSQLQDQERLRRLWAEGVTSGAGRFGTIDDIKREARRRLAEEPGLPSRS
jgi:antitoxin ParD1/3/4